VKTLAEIALEAELASSDALERAVVASDRDGLPLVEHLVREAEIDEVALVAALRRGLRVPTPDPATVKVEPDALRTLSQDVCRRRRVMPLSVFYDGEDRKLRLAMADPTDAIALAEVEHRTGLDILPELMTLSAITEMVEVEYGKIVTEVMRRDRKQPAMSSSRDEDNAPKTVPYHRISDEADLAERFEALLRLLVENKIISEDEFEDQVRQLLKERDAV
jgi:hypothetical protein